MNMDSRADPSPVKDRPRFETYPWAFLWGITLFWGGLWFILWVTLRGTAAALVISFSSIRDLSVLPWLLPVQLLVWVAALAWVRQDLRKERNPPLVVWALCLLLLLTLPPTAFYMMRHISLLSEYELSHNATSRFFQELLHGNVLEGLTIVLSLAIGSGFNWNALRKKYPGLRSRNRSWIAAGWALALLAAIFMGIRWGTLWGILSLAALGNISAIGIYRATLRRQIPKI